MDDTLARLLRLQELNLSPGVLHPAEEQELAELEDGMPGQHLRRANRFFDRGRKAVVPIRGTTCSGCHLQISRSVQIALKQGFILQTCDQCGRVLFLAEGSVASAEA